MGTRPRDRHRSCVVVFALVALVATGCSNSSTESVTETTATAVVSPNPGPTPSQPAQPPTAPAAPAEPSPKAVTLPTPSTHPALSLDDVDLAPIGTYAIARRGAGLTRPGSDDPERREIAVYDTPGGDPRMLVDPQESGGAHRPIRLVNWSDDEGVLVMRVIAGGADSDWLIVQAPSRPHDRYVWVRAADFDIARTSKHIEIDLDDAGSLTLFDDGEPILQSPIVQGRDERPTPTHLSYIEGGIRGSTISPAYGTAILSMGSFSEVLDTFNGGLPRNFLHGTSHPELMGQRVSSGEVRLPNHVLDELIESITPGTPVMIFDSGSNSDDKSAILGRTLAPAMTVPFADATTVTSSAASGVSPQLWRRCEQQDPLRLVCRVGFDAGGARYPYLVAKTGAGVVATGTEGRVIPVYDHPGGPARVLIHRPPARLDRDSLAPLRNPNNKNNPTVLWPLEASPDGEWIRVQAPVYPHRRSVWVRADDFDAASTDYRIEVDLATNTLIFFDGDIEILTNAVVSGRESRPTSTGVSYIDQVIEGAQLSPAYGSYVASYPLFSEALGSFDGAIPNQAIHGTNQPDLMGERVSSGNIRLPDGPLNSMVERQPALIGARVIVFDSSGIGADAAIALLENEPWLPALTTSPTDSSLPTGQPLF